MSKRISLAPRAVGRQTLTACILADCPDSARKSKLRGLAVFGCQGADHKDADGNEYYYVGLSQQTVTDVRCVLRAFGFRDNELSEDRAFTCGTVFLAMGNGVDNTIAKSIARQRLAVRQSKPLRDRNAFLCAVYGTDKELWPLLAVPDEYQTWREPDEAKRRKLEQQLFLAAHLTEVQDRRDRAETTEEAFRWAKAETLIVGWKTPIEMPLGKGKPEKKQHSDGKDSVDRTTELDASKAMLAWQEQMADASFEMTVHTEGICEMPASEREMIAFLMARHPSARYAW